MKENQLTPWIKWWFYLTAAVCTWDASFIVFRPHTLPGGSLHTYWYLYRHYIAIDQRYKDLTDSFVYAQSLLNYVEVVMNIISLCMHYNNNKHTRMLAFTVSVMTFWKTVLYFLMFYELAGGKDYRAGNTLWQEFFLVIIPNGFWVVMPLGCMVALWADIVRPTFELRSSDGYTESNTKGHPPRMRKRKGLY